MVNLGDKAKDTVSGFEGVCIGRTNWLYGCTRITIQPQKLQADGKPIDAQTFDEGQLVVTKRAAVKVGQQETGGPIPSPSQRATPRR